MAKLENEKKITQEIKNQNEELLKQETIKNRSKVLSDNIASSIKEQQNIQLKTRGLASEIAKSSEEALTFLKSRVNKNGELSKTYQSQLNSVNHINSSQASISSLSKIISESAKKEAEARAKNYPNVLKSQEGIREMAESQLSLLKSQEIQNKVMGSLDSLTGGMASKVKDVGGGLLDSSTRMHTLKMGAVGLGALFVGVLIKAVTAFSAKIDAVGETFGFLTNKSKDFRNDLIAAGTEAGTIGKGLADVLSVTSALASEFGITLQDAGDLSNKILDTAVATGLSNDEATKLFGTFMQIGNLTAKQAEDLIEGTAQLAAQVGVAPTAVLQDMASSAEEIAGFTKGSGQNIAEAAIQARQLGLSLQTTAKISEGLLDFENSIRAEVEASVMTGRRLNFQKARQLSLEGDLAGATKEVVKQLGSEEALNNMNVLQRQSIAKSIGVSVSELSKLVRGQEKLTLSTALAGKQFDDLVGQDSLSTLTQITNAVKSIGATLLDNFGEPLSRMLKQFTGPDGLQNIKLQLVAVANVFISIVRAVQDFANIFRVFSADYKLMSKLAVGADGNIQKVDDFRGGRGSITTMAGPAGVFRLNPMDSVLATTNPIPVNDFQSGPAGSMGTQKIEVTGTITGTRDALMAVIESPLG